MALCILIKFHGAAALERKISSFVYASFVGDTSFVSKAICSLKPKNRFETTTFFPAVQIPDDQSLPFPNNNDISTSEIRIVHPNWTR